MPLRPALAVTLLALAPAVRAADDLALDLPRFGLHLARPDAGWVAYVAEAQGDTLCTVSLYRPAMPGVPFVTVYVARHDGAATAEQVREAGAAKLEGQGGVTLDRGEARLADRDAARLHGRMRGGDGQDYEVELLYLVAEPLVYAVQSAWRAGEPFPEAELRPLLDSIALSAPVPEAPPDPGLARLQDLAGRCASDLPWAESWEAAAARARAEDRLVLVAFEHFAGLPVPHVLASGVLADPDVAALVQERFVVVRLRQDDAAPFRAPDAWGMGPHSWGGVLLVATPDGRVLDQFAPRGAFFTDVALRDALDTDAVREHRKRLGSDAPALLDAVVLALRRGELARAAELLGSSRSPRAHLLRASLARRERRGEDALVELAAARDAADGDGVVGAAADALLAEIAADEAVVLLRLGRWEQAEGALRAVREGWPDTPRAGEAEFLLGAVEMLRQGFPHGRERWRALALTRPDDPWAWKAAANVLDGGAFVNGAERPHWPDDAVFAAAARPEAAPLPLARLEQARRDALEFLLAGQQPDGSWISPMEAFAVETGGYTCAVTALCGSALLPQRTQDARVEPALRRAAAWLLAARDAGGLAGGSDLMGVYSIWARAFALRFMAQARAADLGDADALGRAVEGLLESVLDSQQDGGGWPYVLLSGGAQGGLDTSASFLTAGVLLALVDARAAGVQVPQAPLDRGLRALAAMRMDDGTFRYFADVPEAAGDPEAAGRGPVCELALLRGGAGGLDGVRRALLAFDEQRPAFRREWGKDLCHTGEQGEGAHYLLYDWAFAAAAAAELPGSERARWRRELLGDVLAARDAQGAYADMPSLGRAYGTAMALAAFGALDE
jgi:tetratricopeptide (TPR) repeat protein